MRINPLPVYQKGLKRKRGKQAECGDLLKRARLKGGERAYLDWLRLQPSAIDGASDWDTETGRGYCEPAHYRTAKNSGTGSKPEYEAIPLTHAQHALQHRIGTFVFLLREDWERLTEEYLLRWLNS